MAKRISIHRRPFEPRRFRRRVFGQLWMIALQFGLGMVLNLIGSEATGWLQSVYVVALVLHILNAIGLIEGALYIFIVQHSRLAHAAAATTGVAFIGGVFTVWTHNDLWSLVMAAGFAVAAWLYGMLYVRADRALR